jgi:hypothetical protein
MTSGIRSDLDDVSSHGISPYELVISIHCKREPDRYFALAIHGNGSLLARIARYASAAHRAVSAEVE